MIRYVPAARVGEIEEGRGRAVAVEGREIAIFNLGGEFHAIDNTCPHRGASLGEGRLEGEEVVCPAHGWRFNVKTGRIPMAGTVGVHPIRIEGDRILVGLEPPG